MAVDYPELRAILNRIPLGILFVDESGGFLLGNDLAPQFLDVDPLDLMEQGVSALPASTGLAQALVSVRQADRQKERIAVMRGRRWVSITLEKDGFSLFGEPCISVQITDITHQRNLEECRATFQDEILHRIRGPLTSIKTSMAFLASGRASLPPMPEAFREIVNLGYTEVQRLHGLVDDVGELLAIESSTADQDLYMENVDLSSALPKLLRLFRKDPEARNRDILLDMPPDGPSLKVVADYEKLGSILGHVLANALAYSPAATAVKISAGPAAGGTLEIRIQDQGPGIPAQDLPHVCEKFFRSSAVAGVEGRGLGLFLAKSYAEIMRGSLSVESIPGNGTSVALRLPPAPRDEWTP